MIALSTTEFKYITLTETVKEVAWVCGIADKFGMKVDCVLVYYDRQSVICISKNPMFHERTKHIDIKLYFIKDIMTNRKLYVLKISTDLNPANMLTKVVPLRKFKCLDLVKVG